MILVIDNYDSFTYNLVHLVGGHTDDLRVVRNDAVEVEEIRRLAPSAILISPGPGRPAEAGITEDVIRALGEEIPILGVCLGHQAIGEVYGGRVGYAPTLMHGKTSEVQHDGRGIFRDVATPFTATRYHSLVVDRESLPEDLEITAETADGVIMGLRHRRFPVEGIQFHPESVLTREGPKIIANWITSVLHRTPTVV
ncbi:MAG: aminodeoxychorismate/anthranilate synthase component II [Rhodothermales bacterium]